MHLPLLSRILLFAFQFFILTIALPSAGSSAAKQPTKSLSSPAEPATVEVNGKVDMKVPSAVVGEEAGLRKRALTFGRRLLLLDREDGRGTVIFVNH